MEELIVAEKIGELVLGVKYSVSSGHIEDVEGDFVPTAITFSIDKGASAP